MPTTNQLLQEGLRRHRLGDITGAAHCYRKALRQSPDHPNAMHLLGVTAHQEQRHLEALELLQRAQAGIPATPALLHDLGEVLYALKRFSLARENYRRALELQPERSETWQRLALCEQHTGNPEAAARAFARALELAPNHPRILHNYGLLHFLQHRYPEASKLFKKAITAQPDYAAAWYHLALALEQLKLATEALFCYNRALQLSPELPGLRRRRIRCLQSCCAWQELETALRELRRQTENELSLKKIPEESPFLHLTYSQDLSRNLEIARAWSTALQPEKEQT